MKLFTTQLWMSHRSAPQGVVVDKAFIANAGVCVERDILRN